MTDHLPECDDWRNGDDDLKCICAELRACEQRVLLSKPNIELSAVYGYEAGRSDALAAARDAVAALPAVWDEASFKENALAAIDALREQS